MSNTLGDSLWDSAYMVDTLWQVSQPPSRTVDARRRLVRKDELRMRHSACTSDAEKSKIPRITPTMYPAVRASVIARESTRHIAQESCAL
jgi:hypothetical protein